MACDQGMLIPEPRAAVGTMRTPQHILGAQAGWAKHETFTKPQRYKAQTKASLKPGQGAVVCSFSASLTEGWWKGITLPGTVRAVLLLGTLQFTCKSCWALPWNSHSLFLGPALSHPLLLLSATQPCCSRDFQAGNSRVVSFL